MPPQIFTIGHSTQSLDRFLELLIQHEIELLADIRRFPGSHKFPQFNQEPLAAALQKANIEYRWFEVWGGRRGKAAERSSKNLGLRNESFRNYADYMLTDDFCQGIHGLLAAAGGKRTALMCSESVFWRRHRRLVSDFLLVKGIAVRHIMPSGELRPHTLTAGASVAGGELAYPPSDADQARIPFDE